MPPTISSSPDALHRVERVAKVLDEAIRIPGTQIKVGLDAVIGLIPGVGDVIGLGLGSWFIYEAHRLGAPAALKWKMARNVGIDAVSGLVPVIGDIVDVAYRSNRRNLELLRGHFRPAAPLGKTSGRLQLAVRLALTLGVAALVWWFLIR
ncbi:MAG: DUF4112 domain-containing protein [Pseudomonadota bacterium]